MVLLTKKLSYIFVALLYFWQSTFLFLGNAMFTDKNQFLTMKSR